MKNASQEKLQKLKAMVETRQDLNACVALYLTLHPDVCSYVESRDDIEKWIEKLKGDDDRYSEEVDRLEGLLKENPEYDYFPRYNDKPITFRWLRDHLGMGEDPQKTINLLTFLQNGNVVRIRDNNEFNRFKIIMLRRGLTSLMRGWKDSYPATIANLKWQRADPLFSPQGLEMIKSGEWDGKTLYAECQLGKESIGVYRYTVRATVEWYGVEPMSVDDIDGGI